MNRPTRWAAAALLCAVPLAGMTYADPDWLADAGLDVWNAPSLREQAERRQRRGEELETALRAAQSRVTLKAEIVRELLAGRITLREAALAFRTINADNPQFVGQMRSKYAFGSEDELQVRNVLDTARGWTNNSRLEDELSARFEVELEAMRRSGVVRLD